MSFRFLAIAAFALLAACAPASNTATNGPMIGVLEERPGATTTEAARFVVRAMFHKDATGWQSLDPNCNDEACLDTATARAPQQTTWTISRNGEALGEVSARTPATWTLYADVGQQELADGATAPTSGDRSNDFVDAATPLHRPLVATSPAAFADPQSWAGAPAAAEAQHAVRQRFRTQFSEVTNCADASAAPQPRSYTDADIEIIDTYASSAGWRVVTARLRGYACDGPLEGAYANQTYAISPANEARFLDEGLRFLDAGDYDGDGQSEVIFVVTQYNVGGYALYADEFAHAAVFDFSYH
jgi:hypothetical protein